MTMEFPANTAAVRGLKTLWKGQFQGTMAPTCVGMSKEDQDVQHGDESSKGLRIDQRIRNKGRKMECLASSGHQRFSVQMTS